MTKKKTTNSGLEMEGQAKQRLNLGDITWDYHCFNTVYFKANAMLVNWERVSQKPLLMCGATDNLSLLDSMKCDITSMTSNCLEGIDDEMCNDMRDMYSLIHVINNKKYLSSLYYLTTSLCVGIDKSGKAKLITRNSQVVDKLLNIGISDNADKCDTMKLKVNDLVNNTLPVICLEPTQQGFLPFCNRIEVEKLTIIPYVWYNRFIFSLKAKLTNGCLRVNYMKGLSISVAQATLNPYIYDDETTKAVRYLNEYCNDEIGKISFVDIHSKQIVSVNVADIVSIDYLCG